MKHLKLKPGKRIRVTQHVRAPSREDWKTTVEGTFLCDGSGDTGAWFAHSGTGHYQLGRVRLKKDDGEISDLNIDPHTRIQVLEEPVSQPS